MVQVGEDGSHGVQERQVSRLRWPGKAQSNSANESSQRCPPATCEERARQQGPAHRRDYARHDYPNPHDIKPGESPAVRESSNNIAKGTQRVRVQIVNVNPAIKK
jgi:hypothetical protein